MKVTQEFLKQVIKEEIEAEMKEGNLDEGVLDFMKSLGGQAGAAAAQKGRDIKQKIGQKVGQATAAVGGAVQKAKTASFDADMQKQLQLIGTEIQNTFKKIDSLYKRYNKLGNANPELLSKLHKVDSILADAANLLSASAAQE